MRSEEMDGSRNLTSNGVSLCFLPSELLQEIFLRLSMPEIVLLKSVSKNLTSVISSNDFYREYNIRSSRYTWLFVYKKRSPRDSVLYGFTDQSDRWFKIPVTQFLFPIVHPGEDLYFLAASGNFFLFASNNCRELIAVNIKLNSVKKIPPSPLGPRGTSSWRRSGLKLIAGPPGSDQFRFLFTELYENRPILFEYMSETDMWRSVEARESEGNESLLGKVFLSVIHHRRESVVLAVGLGNDAPVILRLRFDGVEIEERLAIGFSTGNGTDRLHVYGDGWMVIVRSEGVDASSGVSVFTHVQLWGVGLNGRRWEYISEVPNGLLERVRKPYRVIMGCLEVRNGIIRVVLVSNYEGLWDLIWLSYDLEQRTWGWIPLPECRRKGLIMAGITFSSGLTI